MTYQVKHLGRVHEWHGSSSGRVECRKQIHKGRHGADAGGAVLDTGLDEVAQASGYDMSAYTFHVDVNDGDSPSKVQNMLGNCIQVSNVPLRGPVADLQ